MKNIHFDPTFQKFPIQKKVHNFFRHGERRKPEPVPPAIEWHRTKPSRLSLPSASLSIISIRSSSYCLPCSNTQFHKLCQEKYITQTKVIKQ